MSARSRVGRLIGDGKYELLSQIGNGSMGTVWLARHVALDRIVAVKMLGLVTSATSEARMRFMTEARSASLLRHANSVRILDYAAEGEDCWLVMEYLEGRNLSELLAEQSPLPPRRAIGIAVQVLAAIAEAHEYGIVHRDLKPANIMLVPWVDDDGQDIEHVKVLDFGIATLAFERPSAASGDVAGTPEYMSPEQAQGLGVDPRSDAYSVGVLLYQMVTGDVPFHGGTALETMLAHVNDTPRAPRTLRAELSERLEAVIMKALAKDPDRRYPSARAMRSALLALPEAIGLRSDSSPKMRPVTSPGMPRPVVGPPPAAILAPTAAPPPGAATASATPDPATPQARTADRKRALWPFAALLVLLGGAALVWALTRPAGPDDTPALARRELARALPPLEVPAPVRIADEAPEAAKIEPRPSPTEPLAETEPAPTAAPAPTEPAPPPAPEPEAPTAEAERAPPAEPLAPRRTPDKPREAKAPKVVTVDPILRDAPREPREPSPAPVAEPTSPAPPEVARPTTADEPAAPPTATAPTRGDAPTPAAAVPPRPPTPEPPEPVAPRAPQTRPALAASVAVRDLDVRGSLPGSTVQRALDAIRPALEQCYRAAAQAAGRDAGGRVSGSLVIDIDGQATEVSLGAFALEGFSACARQALTRARSRQRPDTGSVSASFSLSVSPHAPVTVSEPP